MKIFNPRSPLLYFPLIGTYTLIVLNVIIFLACCIASNSPNPDPALLYRLGAIHNGMLEQGEYWRAVAAAFLHLNPLHILFNMLCLLSWGGVVERRIGTTYFLIIYLLSAIGASVASALLHQTSYFGVGASGAVFGLMGALFALWLLQRIDIQAQFFVVNIGLNLVLMSGPLRVDWQAHLGGFISGVVICAILDPVEWILSKILAHKFPEAVKFSVILFGLIIVGFAFLDFKIDIFHMDKQVPQIAGTILVLTIFLKLTDLVLGIKRGLAVLIGLFGLMYAAIPCLAIMLQPALFTQGCQLVQSRFGLSAFPCSDTTALTIALGSAVAVLAFGLMWGELRRGLNDRGLLDNIFRAARRRSRGL